MRIYSPCEKISREEGHDKDTRLYRGVLFFESMKAVVKKQMLATTARTEQERATNNTSVFQERFVVLPNEYIRQQSLQRGNLRTHARETLPVGNRRQLESAMQLGDLLLRQDHSLYHLPIHLFRSTTCL